MRRRAYVSRRSSLSNKLLLDTSFLLPVLGFETSKVVMDSLPKLRNYTLYYSDLSILEALWKIIKVINEPDEVRRVADGIKAIRDSMNNIAITEEAVEEAIKMYRQGHKDMIDNILYSLAKSKSIKLLTVDKELIKFVKERKLGEEFIALPTDLQ